MKTRAGYNRLFLIIGVIAGSPLVAPQLLAFPYKARIGAHSVYSERPIGRHVQRIVIDADAKMRRDPLGPSRALDQSIFLTEGGWRWRWLAISSSRSFAISRPIGEPIIINRSDPQRDVMANARAGGSRRRLTDILAHELAHGAIRAEFGTLRALSMPTELVEGYADHVAGSSTLSNEQALALLAAGQRHPALPYWTGRKKVERALAANSGDVRRLFNEWQ